MPSNSKDYDYLIIGGGLVGSAIACGLSKTGQRIAVLDEGDRAFRASRGNFGLVWVQGKGWNFAPYAQWSFFAANLWPAFSQELIETTGVDIGYERPGGMEFCLTESEWDERNAEMIAVQNNTGGDFDYEMLDHSALKKSIPQISSSVIGASYSPHDGHVNPLYLLRALHQQMDVAGVDYQPNQRVDSIEHINGEFIIQKATDQLSANNIVLCAGLDNQRLGAMLGMHVPVDAVRGQILISERVQPFLRYPTLHVRQTQEGGLQIGDSHEHVGFDDGTSGQIMAAIAARAVRMFPLLENVQLLRAWGALRVMTPDGCPIYQQSREYPGAFALSTHSGVSLAAVHAGPVSDWICGAAEHPLLTHFCSDRFNVQAA